MRTGGSPISGNHHMENLWKNFGKPKETTKTMENLWKTYRKTVEKLWNLWRTNQKNSWNSSGTLFLRRRERWMEIRWDMNMRWT